MKKLGVTIIAIIVVVGVVGAGAYFGWSKFANKGIEKDANAKVAVSNYSAVFLSNGQVYFGTINGRNNSEIDLRDIYYLQVDQKIQPDQKTSDSSTSTDSPNVVLVKLGEELHGPNDRMRINREHVLFTENLKNDSKVVKAIEDYKKK